uniref:MYND-type domain-containing protein n=1 Tax=Romanomermis culicivorax TaxID=13658 RepID=A0A915K473_ROMCU
MQSMERKRTKGKFPFRSVYPPSFSAICSYPFGPKVDFQAERFKLLAIRSVGKGNYSFRPKVDFQAERFNLLTIRSVGKDKYKQAFTRNRTKSKIIGRFPQNWSVEDSLRSVPSEKASINKPLYLFFRRNRTKLDAIDGTYRMNGKLSFRSVWLKGEQPSAVNCVHQLLLGQRMMADEFFCATCGESRASKRCAACKMVFLQLQVNYCNSQCQKLHWFTHKKWCPKLAEDFKRLYTTQEAKTATAVINGDLEKTLDNMKIETSDREKKLEG